MRALITFSLVVDIDPDEIPEFAAAIEKKGMESLHAGMREPGRILTQEEAEEFQQRYQVYGVSYSVQQEIEPPTEESVV